MSNFDYAQGCKRIFKHYDRIREFERNSKQFYGMNQGPLGGVD
jgi:hypothetical protein